MQNWIIPLLFFWMSACQQQIEQEVLTLDGQFIGADLAQAFIDKNDLVLLSLEKYLPQRPCDRLVSQEMGLRWESVAGQITDQSQLEQMQVFNALMEQEIAQRGIDKTVYWEKVLDCETEKYATQE